MMSDPTVTIADVNEALEELVHLASDHTTLGQMNFLDQLNTRTVAWTTRPGDIDRVSTVLYELISELAYARQKIRA